MVKARTGVWHVGVANIPEHCRVLESVKCLCPSLYPASPSWNGSRELSMNKAGLVLGNLVLSKGKVPAQTFTDLILCSWLESSCLSK